MKLDEATTRLPCTCGPGVTTCPGCQQAKPGGHAPHPRVRREPVFVPSRLVAHCGRWHAITAIPLVLACCGAVLFAEEETS